MILLKFVNQFGLNLSSSVLKIGQTFVAHFSSWLDTARLDSQTEHFQIVLGRQNKTRSKLFVIFFGVCSVARFDRISKLCRLKKSLAIFEGFI